MKFRGILPLVGPLACALAFAVVVSLRLPALARKKDQVFAWIGIVASVLWGLAIFALIVFALEWA